MPQFVADEPHLNCMPYALLNSKPFSKIAQAQQYKNNILFN